MIRLALALVLLLAAPAQAAFTARTTTATGTFEAAAVFTPRNITPPRAVGSRLVGDPLVAEPGTWAHPPQTFTYRWEREIATGWTAAGSAATFTPSATGRYRVVVGGVVSEPVTVESGWGSGLQGEYSSSQSFAFPRMTRLDRHVLFLWGSEAPAPGMASDFAVRWSGRIRPRYTETYRLIAAGADPVAVTVDGVTSPDGRFALEAGREHEIRLELHDVGGDASVSFEWESARQVRQLVPSTHLAPPNRGLKVEMFPGTALSGLPLTWIDQRLDADWGLNAPDVRMTSDFWSARWTGSVIPRHTEEYTFWTVADDGVRVWVDGRLIIDDWVDRNAAERQGRIALEAGRAYSIRYELFENDLKASAQLGWQSARQPREVIPSERLLPFTTTSQEKVP